jgi:hypothetical protein
VRRGGKRANFAPIEACGFLFSETRFESHL